MISTRVATAKATSAGAEPIQPKPPTTGRPPKRAASPAISSGTKTRKPQAAAKPRPMRVLDRSSTGFLSLPPVANGRHDRDDNPSRSSCYSKLRAESVGDGTSRGASSGGGPREADRPPGRPPTTARGSNSWIQRPAPWIEVVGQRRQHLKAVRPQPAEVFEADAVAGRRVVEARLQGEDVALGEHPLRSRHLAEDRQLVQLVADAMAEVVDIAGGGARLAKRRRVSCLLEGQADRLLQVPAACSGDGERARRRPPPH